jgi:hypothetical protein
LCITTSTSLKNGVSTAFAPRCSKIKQKSGDGIRKKSRRPTGHLGLTWGVAPPHPQSPSCRRRNGPLIAAWARENRGLAMKKAQLAKKFAFSAGDMSVRGAAATAAGRGQALSQGSGGAAPSSGAASKRRAGRRSTRSERQGGAQHMDVPLSRGTLKRGFRDKSGICSTFGLASAE